jgi:hypothetical protein
MQPSRSLTFGVLLLAATVLGTTPARAEDSSALRAIFADPPRQYSTGPLWVWNDMLTEEQITSSLRDLAAQKVKQAWVHPRPGLMTPYLSADWFRLWKVALGEAERLDMNLWIYDENSYPSGFAGGWVPELMPESRGRSVVLREESRPQKAGSEVLGIYRLTGDCPNFRPSENGTVPFHGAQGFENVTGKARAGEALPEARYLVAAVKLAPNSGWFGNRSYVDLMRPGVTEKFLDVTLEAYHREIGAEFGKRVPGSFCDEPNLRMDGGGLPWTDGLPAEFQKRWGYALVDNLPCLFRPVGEWKKVRHDYYRVLLEQFIEHWSKPYHDYCEKHGLEWTGHYWDHEWPNCVGVPDNMAMYAWHQRPAIDCLRNQYQEHTHAQFGNVRMVRELGSIANQLGKRRTLCETYGASGWDLRFEDMKRIGDWLEVLGVNTIDQHLADITLRGARKADYPQSFSYHEPWWPAYHVLAQYFTRLSAALSHGEQVNHILVIEPTTTAWMYQGDEAQLAKIGKSFFDLVMSLEQAQVEYDIGCEDVIARHGKVGTDRDSSTSSLIVGKRTYDTVVLPPGLESVDSPTMKLLEAFADAGGKLISCGPPPALVDGKTSDRGAKLASGREWQQIKAAGLPQELAPYPDVDRPAVRRATRDRGILFHQCRRLDDGELLLLVNTDITSPSRGEVEICGGRAEVWDCHTGRIAPYPCEWPGGANAYYSPFEVPPCGSLLLFFTRRGARPVAARTGGARTVQPAGPPQLRRIEPNVLTLDFIDLTAGGQTRRGLYFHRANQLAFAANGIPQNPWDSAVQFKDELISKNFPAGSGFQATYRFTIADQVPKPLEIVIERPDLYTIACNGLRVSASPRPRVPGAHGETEETAGRGDAGTRRRGDWWLDKAFGRIDITAAAKVGENAVTIAASPMTMFHELEPAYLLGDFQVQPRESGFIVSPPKPLDLGAWDKQGHPFYAAGVTYSEEFNLPRLSGRYRVALGNWYGSVARVAVNGKEAGYIGWQPWECDVSDFLRPGANTIEVTVIGTLKNTLGPHHAGKIRGMAGPAIFHQGPETGPPPGAAYDTIGYGLFEPFLLKNIGQ